MERAHAAELGDLEKALGLAARAETLATTAGADLAPIASLLLAIGRRIDNDSIGGLTNAMRHYRHALELLDSQAEPGLYGVILHDIADIHLALGRVAEAVATFEIAIENKSRAGDRIDLARTWYALGAARARSGGDSEQSAASALAAFDERSR